MASRMSRILSTVQEDVKTKITSLDSDDRIELLESLGEWCQEEAEALREDEEDEEDSDE